MFNTQKMIRHIAFAALLATGLSISAFPLPATAQTIIPQATIVDYQEEMRGFIRAMGQYARKLNPNFQVIAHNGLELLAKPDPENETRFYPARTYLQSIDGVLASEVFSTLDKPKTKEKMARQMFLLDTAKQNGLKILTLDYAGDKKITNEILAHNEKAGFVSFVAANPQADTIPKYNSSAWHEDSDNILSARDVHNFLYLGNTRKFGTENNLLTSLIDTNHDMIALDVFHGRTAIKRETVNSLKFKKLGARRLVFARMNITTASSFAYYWKPVWREGNPAFISAPLREDPDSYRANYTQAEWQNVIFGGPQSYLYGIIQLGFDGVILEGLDAYRFFDGTEEEDE